MHTKITPSLEVVVTKDLMGGTKRLHKSDNFDSDKELAPKSNFGIQIANLYLVIVERSQGGWIEIKNKKGKRGRIKDYVPR
jgi:hypothetical protein